MDWNTHCNRLEKIALAKNAERDIRTAEMQKGAVVRRWKHGQSKRI